MTGEEKLSGKLRKWVEEHPEDADVQHINLTTQKEFTIRGVLEMLDEEEKTGTAIVDSDTLEIKKQIEKWIGG